MCSATRASEKVVQESDRSSLSIRPVCQYDDCRVGGGVPAEDRCLLGRQQSAAQGNPSPSTHRESTEPLDRDRVQRVVHQHWHCALRQEVQLFGNTDKAVRPAVHLRGRRGRIVRRRRGADTDEPDSLQFVVPCRQDHLITEPINGSSLWVHEPQSRVPHALEVETLGPPARLGLHASGGRAPALLCLKQLSAEEPRRGAIHLEQAAALGNRRNGIRIRRSPLHDASGDFVSSS